MASPNLPTENELEDKIQKRIGELEKTNQALQAEIIECKKNEEMLAFRAQLFSKIREAVFSTDINYVINYWNEEAEKLFGWAKEEALGKESGELLKTKIESTSRAQEIPKLWDKGHWEGEVQYLRRDGTYFLVDVKATVLKDTNGKETGIITVARDITKRKRVEEALREAYQNIQVQSEELQAANEELQAQSEELQVQAEELHIQTEELKDAYEALRESEKRYCLLFNNSMDAIILTDPRGSGKILSANPAACKMLGWSEEELIGKDREFIIDPEDSELFTLLDERVNSGSARSQLTYKSKDRTKFIGELSTALFTDISGEPRAVAIIRDITERKREEEKLRLSEEKFACAFANNPAAIALTRLEDGLFLDVNDTWVALTGYSRDEAIGNFARTMRIWPTPEAAARFVQELREKGSLYGWEQEFYNKSGKIFTAQLSAQILTINGEKVILSTLVDITEKKQAAEAMRESEEKYRYLFENLNSAAILIEPILNGNGRLVDFRYLMANPSVKKHLGKTPDEIVGKLYSDVFSYQGRNPVFDIYEEVLFSGKPFKGEIFLPAINKHFDMAVYRPIVGRLAFIVSDISDRKKAEEALQESEERYRNIVETANEGVWIVDSEARTTYVNKKMTEMLGYTREEMTGKSGQDFTDEEGKEISRQNMEKRQQDIDESHEFKLIRKDGSPLWALISAKSLFDENGKFVGSMSMLTDITRRKEAEAKLKETLDNLEAKVKERTKQLAAAYKSLQESEKELAEAQKIAHLGNWSRNLITDEIHWSDEVYRIFGFKPQEFGVNYDVFLSHIHSDDQDRVINAAKQALKGKLSSIDYRIFRSNGEESTVHEELKVVFDEKNIPVQMRGTIQDITEQKQAEEALVKIKEARIKEIHHRIKNNLQIISSLLDLEAERFSDNKVLNAFKESQNRVASMALIHEELYKGKEPDNLDFAEYLRKLTANILNSYNSKNDSINLKLSFEEVYLDMDTAIPLGIIVNELVSNSFKHAFPDGRPREINITLQRVENFTTNKESFELDNSYKENNFHYVLTVADNGIGISKEIDIQNAETLGLQLVNILVDQIDGCIELKRDHGTEFIISFNNIEKRIN